MIVIHSLLILYLHLEIINAQPSSPRSVVTVVPVERSCPSDYVMSDSGTCVGRAFTKPDVSCRFGFKLTDNSECLKNESFPPEKVCPPGLTFGGDSCHTTISTPASLQCDVNDDLINGECWKSDDIGAKIGCPKGYQLKLADEASGLETPKCQYVTTFVPQYVCPENYIQSSGNDRGCELRSSSPPTVNCPPGTMLSGRLCVNPQMESAVAKRCASGGEMDINGNCVAITSVDPDLVCPPGFVLLDGRCERPAVNMPLYRCPKDFVLNGDVCVQTVPAEMYCGSDRETLTSSGTCVFIQSEPSVRACPQKSVPGPDGNCIVQVIYENDVEISCDEQYSLVDGRCLKKIKTTDVLLCPRGYSLSDVSNVCENNELVEAVAYCPHDGQYDAVTENCLATVSTDVLVTCPKGSDYNGATGRCQGKHAYHPAVSCPEGFTVRRIAGKSDKTSSSAECVKHETVPVLVTCNNMGTLDEFGTVCRRVSAASAQFRCPSGFHLEEATSECVKSVETSPLSSCPDGFQQHGNACVGKLSKENALSTEDRKMLEEAIEGMTLNKKIAYSLRKASASSIVEKPDAELLNLADQLSSRTSKTRKTPIATVPISSAST